MTNSQTSVATPFSEHVVRQSTDTPEIYGRVDFRNLPERFTTDVEEKTTLSATQTSQRESLLADTERVALIRDYTMTGDRVADAYAALIPKYGFRKLVAMLDQACAQGVDTVEDAPPELAAFIGSMEDTPDWVDMEMVERGARRERIKMALIAPYVIRGGFIATFMNKYSALPMSMTGTLSNTTSAKRVFETASFFTMTTLPGALERYGKGFNIAAKVRLMHSMVRFNIMRTNKWDIETFGIPIPQVDQMPAGQIGSFLLSFKLLEQGRTEFNEDERSEIELSRYRSFLLGLPQELLGETPQEIANLMMTRHATLREGYDDETCGVLVRATMAADLSSETSLGARLHIWLERGFSKFYFIRNFCNGEPERAKMMGVEMSLSNKIAMPIAAGFIFSRLSIYQFALKIPGLKGIADRRILKKLAQLLDSYGHADFVTDAEQYKSSDAA